MIKADKATLVTLDSPQQHLLRLKTKDFAEGELSLAKDIYDQLMLVLSSHFPAGGLAAPQIGILKSLFIFSYDRNPKHLEAVINPRFIPLNQQKVEGWEGCLSVIFSVWKLAKIARYEKINVIYVNLKGEWVNRVLEGFAARVFQHEYDHLQGIVNIEREDAVIKEFATEDELQSYMQVVKKREAVHYQAPV